MIVINSSKQKLKPFIFNNLKRLTNFTIKYKIDRIGIKNTNQLIEIKNEYNNRKILIFSDEMLSKNIDGITNLINNISLISLKKDQNQLPLLVIHELLHLVGFRHCCNGNCLMGITCMDNQRNYSWQMLSIEKNTKLAELLCEKCLKIGLRTKQLRI